MKMFVVSVDDKATGTAILLYLHSFIHEWNIQPFPAASLQIWSACLCPWPRSLRALCSPCESSDSRRLPGTRYTAHEVTASSRWTGDGWRWSNQARCSASYWNLFCFWAGSYFSAPFSAQLFPKICLLSPCFLCLPHSPPHCMPSTCWCSHLSKATLVKISTIFTLPTMWGKVSAYNAEDLGSIPGSGRSPGEGNGNPLQYSCLENPLDGGAW